jgi:GTPase involved in cell partitioning and DNA repair
MGGGGPAGGTGGRGETVVLRAGAANLEWRLQARATFH